IRNVSEAGYVPCRTPELVRNRCQTRLEQPLLGLVITTDERHVDAGVVRDLPYSSSSVAVTREAAARRVEEQLTGLRRVATSGLDRGVVPRGSSGARMHACRHH